MQCNTSVKNKFHPLEKKPQLLIQTMSLTANNPTIDNLVQSSLESEANDLRLKWIPYSEITNMEPTIMLLLLGSDETCTPTLVSEFARIYSLPTHKYSNDVSQFRRYSTWLKNPNYLIKGFTKYEDNFYMVVDKRFYYCYSRYGFCIACGILWCSPVW